MGEPKVVDGMRSPADLDELLGAGLAKAARRLPPLKAKPKPAPTYDFPTKFQSAAETYKTLINIRTPAIDGSGRMLDNKFFVIFNNHFLDITKDAYPFGVAKVAEALQKHSGYGIGLKFWDVEEARSASREAEKKQLLDRVEALKRDDPELADTLRASLAEDFKTETDSAAPAA